MLKRIASVIAAMLFASGAFAQSTPGFVPGQVPTAAQWNSYFAAKQDLLTLGTAARQNTGTSGNTLPFLSGNNQFGGVNHFTSSLFADADFYLSNAISPASLSGNQNDYAPTGNATAVVFRISAGSGPFTITGLANGFPGRIVIVQNVGSNDFILAEQSGSSSAANRFEVGTVSDLTIPAKNSVVFAYDGTSSRWRKVSGSTTPIDVGTGLQFDAGGSIVTTGGRARRNSVTTDQTATDLDCNTIYNNTSMSSSVNITLQAIPKPDCNYTFSSGLQKTFVIYTGTGLGMPGWANDPITVLPLEPGGQDSYFQQSWDGSKWTPTAYSRVLYDQITPRDSSIITHGQVCLAHNSGLSQEELSPCKGPGGLMTNARNMRVPDTLLALPDSALTNNVPNYLYGYSNTDSDGTVSGTSNHGGLIQVTITHSETTNAIVQLACNSIGGSITANGNNWSGLVINSTHIDLIGSNGAAMAPYTSGGKCRIFSLQARTTAPVVIGNGVLSLPADAHYTYVGLIDNVTSHVPNNTWSYFNPTNTQIIHDLLLGSFTESNVASASTLDLTLVASPKIQVTGTTNITAISATPNSLYYLRFANVLTITNTPLTLSLPGGANITTAAGDTATVAVSATGAVRFLNYQRATVGPDVAAITGSPASGNLAKFSGATSLTNGDLSGDCTTSGTLAIACTKTGGVSFAASATTDATNASNISSGTLAAARGGAGTITGALKGSGAGVVSQAACADLSNGAGGCSTAIGTSGAVLPLLNGTNAWSGVQSFNDGDLSLNGLTSGNSILKAPATGGGTMTFPGGSDTVAAIAAAQIFTNKTYDTAGTGNVWKLNGVTISTGSGLNKELWMDGNFVENSIASATTTDLTVATGPKILITGTTTITAFTGGNNNIYLVKFGSALILTNGISLNLPGGANITTAANDFAFLVTSSTGATRVLSYNRAALTPDLAPAASPTFSGTVTLPDASSWTSSGLTAGQPIAMGNKAITGGNAISSNSASGYGMFAGAATSTAPTVGPNRASNTTGLGAQASGNMSLIANGTEMMRITSTLITLPTIGSDATHTDSTVCQDTTTHALYAGSGTAGICLGTSSARFKRDINPLEAGLPQILGLEAKRFFYKAGYGDSGAREQFGFLAEDVVHVLPKLVGLDAKGAPNSVDLLGMVPVLVNGEQELSAGFAAMVSRQRAIDDRVANLEGRLGQLEAAFRAQPANDNLLIRTNAQ